MSSQGRPPVDQSKKIRRSLAEGKTLDQALAELRAHRMSIFDCIVSVRSVYHCDIAEAKRLVSSSTTWADVVAATEAEFSALADEEDAKA
jgi:hypothetical protein